jgi:hypothetical protein
MNIAAVTQQLDRVEVDPPSLDVVEVDAEVESPAETPSEPPSETTGRFDPENWKKPVPANHPFGIDPRWDVAQIATPGHMLTARVSTWSHRMYGPMIALGIAAFTLFIGGQAVLPVISASPRWITSALTYDPNTYFNLGGGLRGGPNVAFLGNYAPRPESLSMAKYGELVEATAKDIAAHGYNAADWTAVGELQTTPKITRPEKVFAQWGDRLKDGVIAIPETPAFATIVAHVEGQWGVTIARAGQCWTLQGPVIESCEDATENSKDALSGQAITALEPMDPRKAPDQE